jgi:hypothetical protein
MGEGGGQVTPCRVAGAYLGGGGGYDVPGWNFQFNPAGVFVFTIFWKIEKGIIPSVPTTERCWRKTNIVEVRGIGFSVSTQRRVRGVEGLYCKRPIQCLASSEKFTPHLPASVYPPPLERGGGHTRWVESGWGVNSSEDARHCSLLYI